MKTVLKINGLTAKKEENGWLVTNRHNLEVANLTSQKEVKEFMKNYRKKYGV